VIFADFFLLGSSKKSFGKNSDSPDGLQIEVLPKIGRRNASIEEARALLLRMLRCLQDFPYFESGPASLNLAKLPLLEVFIHQFLQAVSIVIKRGIRSDYCRQEGNLPALRGKLLSAQHLKQNLVRKERLNTAYDEFVPDRPENRLVRAALDRVLRWSRTHANQRLAREQVFTFDEIKPSDNIPSDFQKVRLDRGMHYYQAALNWAKLILDNQSPLTGVGGAEAISLMFPMAKLFEAYVGKHLQKNLKSDFIFHRTPKYHYLTRHYHRDIFRLEPDYLIYHTKENSQQTLVMDAKWKLLNSQDTSNNYGISRGDFFQLFAYSQFYVVGENNSALVLIYPKTDEFDKPLMSFQFKSRQNPRELWVLLFCLEQRKLIAPESSPVVGYLDVLSVI
jgi:5-methylcytosine-specific restriction enzyme subunit McrC